MPIRPLPVLPGAYYGILEGSVSSLPMGNTFCFQSTNLTATSPDAAARALVMATSLANQWVNHMLASLSNFYSGVTAKVYALQYATLPAQEDFAVGAGANTAALANPTLSVLVKHTVFRRGRGSQGRSYIGALCENLFDGGERTITDGAVTGFTTQWNAFINAVLADMAGAYPSETWTYVELSRVGTGATHPITASGAEKAVAYQRRRARRRSV